MKLTKDSTIGEMLDAVLNISSLRESSYSHATMTYNLSFYDATRVILGDTHGDINTVVSVLVNMDYVDVWDAIHNIAMEHEVKQ